MTNLSLFTRFTIPLLIIGMFASIITISGINETLFIYLNNLAESAPLLFWANVTLLADAATGFALLTLYIKKNNKLIYWAIFGGIACAVVIRIMKVGFNAPRPPAVLDNESFQIIGKAIKSKSFPSGHTATAFFMAAIISGCYKHKVAVYICLGLATLLAMSRIATGVHWPIDLCVGAMIGWALGVIVLYIASNKPELTSRQFLFTTTTCMLGSVYLFFMNSHLPGVDWMQKGISIVCFGYGLNLVITDFKTRRKV